MTDESATIEVELLGGPLDGRPKRVPAGSTGMNVTLHDPDGNPVGSAEYRFAGRQDDGTPWWLFTRTSHSPGEGTTAP